MGYGLQAVHSGAKSATYLLANSLSAVGFRHINAAVMTIHSYTVITDHLSVQIDGAIWLLLTEHAGYSSIVIAACTIVRFDGTTWLLLIWHASNGSIVIAAHHSVQFDGAILLLLA